jgi:hypothetical protein
MSQDYYEGAAGSDQACSSDFAVVGRPVALGDKSRSLPRGQKATSSFQSLYRSFQRFRRRRLFV